MLGFLKELFSDIAGASDTTCYPRQKRVSGNSNYYEYIFDGDPKNCNIMKLREVLNGCIPIYNTYPETFRTKEEFDNAYSIAIKQYRQRERYHQEKREAERNIKDWQKEAEKRHNVE